MALQVTESREAPTIPPVSGAKDDVSRSEARVAKNAAIYLVGQTVSWAATFLSISIIPRYLGEAAMGQLAIASATIGTISTFLVLGMDNYLTTEIARDHTNSERLLRASLGLRLTILPLLVMLVVCLLAVTQASSTVWILAVPMLMLTAVTYLIGPLRHALVGMEDARRVSLFDVRASVAPLAAIPFLHFGPLALPVVNLCVTVPILAGMFLWMRRRIRLTPLFDVKEWGHLIRGGLPFLMNNILIHLYAFGSVLLLKHFSGEAAVGVLSQTQKLQGTLLFLPTAVGTALLPTLARIADTDREQFRHLQRKMLVVMVTLGLPVAMLLFFLAEPFCRLLYGTEKFQDMPFVLQVAAFNTIPLYISGVVYRFLVAERKNAIWSVFLLGTVLLNVILCAIFIPLAQSYWHNPAAGAMVASVTAEIVTVFAAFALLKVNPLDAPTTVKIVKAILATMIAGGLVWLTRTYFILIPVLLGSGAFLVLSWVFRIIDLEDQQKIVGLLRRKLIRRRQA
jgi:O-antigen/teichoic acid export membrane protein